MKLPILFSAVVATFLVSCSPSSNWNAFGNPARGGGVGVGQGAAAVSAAARTAGQPGRMGEAVGSMTAEEQRQLREKRTQLGSGQSESVAATRDRADAGSRKPEEALPPLPSVSQDYPYAIPVPGRPGRVWNPYTNQPVDVRGVEAGRLIYDDKDPANRYPDGTLMPPSEMPHKFRVPRTRVY